MGGQRVRPAARDDRGAERGVGVAQGARARGHGRAAGRGRAPGRARGQPAAPAAGRPVLAAHVADCQRGQQPGRAVPVGRQAGERARGGAAGRARAGGGRERRARRRRVPPRTPGRTSRAAATIIQQLAGRCERAETDAPVRHHRWQVQRQQQTWRRAQRRGRGRVEARAAEVGGTRRLADHAAICAARPSGPHDQGSCLLREPVHDVRGLDGVGLRSPPTSAAPAPPGPRARTGADCTRLHATARDRPRPSAAARDRTRPRPRPRPRPLPARHARDLSAAAPRNDSFKPHFRYHVFFTSFIFFVRVRM